MSDQGNRENLLRIIFSFLERTSDAKKNLMSYLHFYIRPEFTKRLNIDSIFNPIVHKFQSVEGFVKDIFLEDLVGKFIDEGKPGELRSLLRTVVKYKLNLSMEDSEKLIHPQHDIDEKLIKEASPILGPVIFKFLNTFMNLESRNKVREMSKFKKPIRDKSGIPPEEMGDDELDDELPSSKLPSDQELDKDIRNLHDWEEGLIKDVIDLINRKIKDPNRRKTFKIILRDVFLSSSPKSITDIAKDLDLNRQTLQEQKESLAKLLKGFLTAQGLGGTYLEQGGLTKEEIKIPDYREILKDPDNSKDFKEFLKIDSRSSQLTKDILDMLAEGIDIPEIAKKLDTTTENISMNVKARYFNSQYKEWYREHVKNIREATFRIKLALMFLAAAPEMTPAELAEFKKFTKQYKRKEKPEVKPVERPREPGKKLHEKVTPESTDFGSSKVHREMIEQAIKRGDVVIVIGFSSDFDVRSFISGKKERGKDDANFKYLNYEVIIDISRKYGKKEQSVKYLYTQKLNDDGSFSGTGTSRLWVNKILVTDDLKDTLDKFIKEKVLSEGVIPHDFSVQYKNEKTGHIIYGIKRFRMYYPEGIGRSDPVHKDRIKEYERLQKRVMIGPGQAKAERERAQELYFDLNHELNQEKSKGNAQDTVKVEKLKKRLTQIAKLLRGGKVEDSLQEIEDIITEEELLRKTSSEKLAAIFPPDPAHKDLIKKRISPGMAKTKEEEAYELLYDLRFELREERSKGNAQDTVKVEKLEKRITQFKKLLRGGKFVENSNSLQELENIIIKEKLLRKTSSEKLAAVFPPPESEDVKKLISLFEYYDKRIPGNPLFIKPNPILWMDFTDLRVLLKKFRIISENIMNQSIQDTKKSKGLKKDDKEEKIIEIQQKFKEDIENDTKWFKSYPDDLKKRKDEFKNKHPKDFEELSKRKDMDWINDKSKIQEFINNVESTMKKPIIDEDRDKPRSMKMVEKRKYLSLEPFVDDLNNTIKEAAENFNDNKLIPRSTAESRAVLEKGRDRLLKTNEDLLRRAKELEERKENITDEESEQIKQLRLDISNSAKEILKYNDRLSNLSTIPALEGAYSLLYSLNYFSSLFSELSSYSWYKNKHIVMAEDEILAEDELPTEVDKKEKVYTIDDLKELRNQIVGMARKLAGKNIWNDKIIKSDVSRIKGLLNSFIENITKVSDVKTASLPYEKIIAEEKPSREELIKRSIVPEGELHKAQSLIEKMKNDEVLKKSAEIAQQELKKIISSVVGAFKGLSVAEKIKELAKKAEIPEERAHVRLRMHLSTLVKMALDKFSENWEDFIVENKKKPTKKKEITPLGNLPFDNYKKISDFVEKHLPSLFEQVGTPTEPEKPSPGIPTEASLRELIEKKFGRGKPDEMKEMYQEEIDEWDVGGGGGKRGKSRKKPIKINPPEGTREELKYQFINAWKDSPRKIVLTVMALYTKKIRDKLKENDTKYLDPGDVIDGFVRVLKNLYNTIIGLKVEPSDASQFKTPPPGIYLSGQPEIAIDSYKEAMEVYNKLRNIYEEINYYIEPDTVGVPPKDLSALRSKSSLGKKYLPYNFLEWAQHFRVLEEKEVSPGIFKKDKKTDYKPTPEELSHWEKQRDKMDTRKEIIHRHASKGIYNYPTDMSYRITLKFSGLDNNKDILDSLLQ